MDVSAIELPTNSILCRHDLERLRGQPAALAIAARKEQKP